MKKTQLASLLNIIKYYQIYRVYFRGIVLEYRRDGRKIHENWLGVVTNFPTYDWHMSNLQYYANMRRTDFGRFRMGGKSYNKML